jgi:hypothetical protein
MKAKEKITGIKVQIATSFVASGEHTDEEICRQLHVDLPALEELRRRPTFAKRLSKEQKLQALEKTVRKAWDERAINLLKLPPASH